MVQNTKKLMPGVQLLPFFAAKGQGVYFIFHFSAAKTIHQIKLWIKIYHHAADIKNDAFIHNCCLACVGCFSPIFSIVYHNRAGAFHPFGIENAAPAYAVAERGERCDHPGAV